MANWLNKEGGAAEWKVENGYMEVVPGKGDIRTKAEPHADGSYRIKGNKIFISGGDQPISENIVHMVLARLPDAPPGPQGITGATFRNRANKWKKPA